MNRFPLKTGLKTRWVNDPIPVLKTALKDWNNEVTERYIQKLEKYNLTEYSQAYLPNKSIKTNAKIHQNSNKIIKFDFANFYDSVKFEYIESDIIALTNATVDDLPKIKRLIIDEKTGGITQGLPVSGAFAGLALIPFWSQLQKSLHPEIMFTQYSDDLTFSLKTTKDNPLFNVDYLTEKINKALHDVNRNFEINTKKTTTQKDQFRKITGVRINHNNQLTCSRKDYRLFRTITHVLRKENNTDKVLKQFGFKSKASFTGKISYMRSIDETGKINKFINKNSDIFLKHNLFKAWILEQLSIYT